MIPVGWGGVALLVASLVLAIVARRTLWGMRLQPSRPVAQALPPQGSILLAAQTVRGFSNGVIPLLADWQTRGVILVEQRGPDLPANLDLGEAWGPEWHFTVVNASDLDEVELPLLRIFVPGAPARGATSILHRDDNKTRDAIIQGVYEAISRQVRSFGPKRIAKPFVAVALVGMAVIGGLAGLIGFVAGSAGPTAIAWTFLGSCTGIGVVVAVCRSGRSPSDGERRYRQSVVDLEAWVHTTASIDPGLAGWAMIWNLPGRWEEFVPEAIASLRSRDHAFLPGHFAKRLMRLNRAA